MAFVRRPASESPIIKRMLEDATTAEQLDKIMQYGMKVDRFNERGVVVHTSLAYEGPDLSPGGDRPNSMKGTARNVKLPLYDSDGHKIEGRKAAVLYPS